MKLNRRISGIIDRPDDKRLYVKQLFSRVAPLYDLTNDVMSLSLHRRWKRRLLKVAGVRAGQRVLDLAAGTGDLARAAAGLAGAAPSGRVDAGAAPTGGIDVVAADFTLEMMQAGRRRGGARVDGWVCADALRLPFPDGSFDRVVIGYGLRNFADLDASLSESFRCLRKGGRLAALDFGHPRLPLIRRGYIGYLNLVARVAGWALHRDAESYVYIPESLKRFPSQWEIVKRMEAAGFEGCGCEDLVLGAMAITFGDRR